MERNRFRPIHMERQRLEDTVLPQHTAAQVLLDTTTRRRLRTERRPPMVAQLRAEHMVAPALRAEHMVVPAVVWLVEVWRLVKPNEQSLI